MIYKVKLNFSINKDLDGSCYGLPFEGWIMNGFQSGLQNEKLWIEVDRDLVNFYLFCSFSIWKWLSIFFTLYGRKTIWYLIKPRKFI